MDFGKAPKIVVSADIAPNEAVQLVEKLLPARDKIAALKLGSLHAMDMGLRETIKVLKEVSDFPLIYDHQKGCSDIPDIVERQVLLASDCGIDAVIGVPHGAGPRSLERFCTSCKSAGIEAIVLLEMTHEGAHDYHKEDTARKIFDHIMELGVKNIVAPGNKYERLREYRKWIDESGSGAKIMSPGIGAQGGQAEKAVGAGTDYPIVGRAIYLAEDPKKAVDEIYESAVRGYEKR
ncbi:TPA: orotidine 5'-phosphate decarboxylase [archaeon]|nr:orotidine 5'-phosphate decarboxylase [Candidatus Undinarchaeales archaeon SRR5007147.bin71]